MQKNIPSLSTDTGNLFLEACLGISMINIMYKGLSVFDPINEDQKKRMRGI